MKLTIELTPEMRIRLMHAETISLEVPDDMQLADTPMHPDDAAIDRFAAAMKAKMAAARAKGRSGWDSEEGCSDLSLARSLVSHIFKGNAGTFEDVANFAMMLHQRNANPVVLQYAASSDLPALTTDDRMALQALIQSRNAGTPWTIDQEQLQDLSMKGALHKQAAGGYELSAAGWSMLAAAPQFNRGINSNGYRAIVLESLVATFEREGSGTIEVDGKRYVSTDHLRDLAAAIRQLKTSGGAI